MSTGILTIFCQARWQQIKRIWQSSKKLHKRPRRKQAGWTNTSQIHAYSGLYLSTSRDNLYSAFVFFYYFVCPFLFIYLFFCHSASLSFSEGCSKITVFMQPGFHVFNMFLWTQLFLSMKYVCLFFCFRVGRSDGHIGSGRNGRSQICNKGFFFLPSSSFMHVFTSHLIPRKFCK